MRFALMLLAVASVLFGADPGRPKVRAVTAFINIDSKNYEAEIQKTMQFLNGARDAYLAAGWEVETVRIVTQPFAKYVGGMKRDEAIAFFKKLDALSAKLKYSGNIGTAMVGDADDASQLGMLATVLATTHLNASLNVAGEDGVHWRAIREAAKVIKATADRSPHGGGNFNFAVTAMVKPYGPFYPGAYHLGTGQTFAVGLEGANVVGDVFAKYHEPREAEKQLAAALSKHLPSSSRNPSFGGTSYWVKGPAKLDADELAPAAQAKGVLINPGRVCFGGANGPRNYLRLAFSSIDEKKIEPGIKLLSELIKNPS